MKLCSLKLKDIDLEMYRRLGSATQGKKKN